MNFVVRILQFWFKILVAALGCVRTHQGASVSLAEGSVFGETVKGQVEQY